MELIEILRGQGRLEVDADSHPVRYDLALLRDERGVAQLLGALGGDYGALYQAFDRGRVVLVTADGTRIALAVTRMDGGTAVVVSIGAPGTGDAADDASGPEPDAPSVE